MNFSRIIFLTGSLLITFCVFAQLKPVITAKVDKNRVLLGEHFVLTIEATVSPEFNAKILEVDSLPHFEIRDKPLVIATATEGMLNVIATYHLCSFDSGQWVIPSFGISSTLKTDTIPIDVIFSAFDPQQDYHDIKDIIPVKKKRQIPWWWYAGGGLLVAGIIVYILLKRKKPIKQVKPAIVADPYKEALEELDALERTSADPKTFHTKLTGIFRVYLFRRKNILSLQKTTEDLVLQIKNLEIPKEEFEKLSQSLRVTDFVKFAKYIPGDDDNRQVFIDIRNAIITIESTCSTTG